MLTRESCRMSAMNLTKLQELKLDKVTRALHADLPALPDAFYKELALLIGPELGKVRLQFHCANLFAVLVIVKNNGLSCDGLCTVFDLLSRYCDHNLSSFSLDNLLLH